MSNVELNMDQMESVSGGRGGSPTKLPEKTGYIVYQIVGDDNLTKIAKKFNTTVNAIMKANPTTIDNKNFIRAGFWIYIPQ